MIFITNPHPPPDSGIHPQPKRTTLHVFITIGVVFLLTFLITFFIYPRSPELQLDPTVLHTIQPSSVNITTDAPTRVDFVFENRWNLYNPNYFSVTMVSFTVQGKFYDQATASPTVRQTIIIDNITD
jgi:hypothetical protein